MFYCLYIRFLPPPAWIDLFPQIWANVFFFGEPFLLSTPRAFADKVEHTQKFCQPGVITIGRGQFVCPLYLENEHRECIRLRV